MARQYAVPSLDWLQQKDCNPRLHAEVKQCKFPHQPKNVLYSLRRPQESILSELFLIRLFWLCFNKEECDIHRTCCQPPSKQIFKKTLSQQVSKSTALSSKDSEMQNRTLAFNSVDSPLQGSLHLLGSSGRVHWAHTATAKLMSYNACMHACMYEHVCTQACMLPQS